MKERKGVNISSIASLVSSLALLGMFFLPWIHAGRRITLSLWDIAIGCIENSYTMWFGIVFFVFFVLLLLNAILKIFTTTKWLSITLSILMTNYLILTWFFMQAFYSLGETGIGFIISCVLTIALMVSAFLPTGKVKSNEYDRTVILEQPKEDKEETVRRIKESETTPLFHDTNKETRKEEPSNEKEHEIEELKKKLAALESEKNSYIEQQRTMEAQRQREAAMQQQRAMEAQRQREAAMQQQRAMEAQRQREAAMQQQRAMEAQRQREAAMQQQRAMEAQRQREAAMQQQRAMEAQRQREVAMQQQRMAGQSSQGGQKPQKPIERTTIDRSRFK